MGKEDLNLECPICGKMVFAMVDDKGALIFFDVDDAFHRCRGRSPIETGKWYTIIRTAVGDCHCGCHIPSGRLCEAPYCCKYHWRFKDKYENFVKSMRYDDE